MKNSFSRIVVLFFPCKLSTNVTCGSSVLAFIFIFENSPVMVAKTVK